MLYFVYGDKGWNVCDSETKGSISSWEISELPGKERELIAEQATKNSGELHIVVDHGEWVSPQFDIIRAPAVGDEVSYAFNGDYSPCGEIVKISKTLKVITTSEGQKFYRKGNSGQWKYCRTWTLVRGHIERRNQHF